jgi:hypothetical protein
VKRSPDSVIAKPNVCVAPVTGSIGTAIARMRKSEPGNCSRFAQMRPGDFPPPQPRPK